MAAGSNLAAVDLVRSARRGARVAMFLGVALGQSLPIPLQGRLSLRLFTPALHIPYSD